MRDSLSSALRRSTYRSRGLHLYKEIIRENLDLGCPEQVSLIFERRIIKRTLGRLSRTEQVLKTQSFQGDIACV